MCDAYGAPDRKPGDAGVRLALVHPKAGELLLGLAPPLAGRLPGMVTAPPGKMSYSAQLATCWVAGAAPVWRLFPAALDWLRRVRATRMLAMALQRLPLEDDAPPVPLDVEASVAAIRRGDVIVTAVLDDVNTLVHVATAGGRTASAASTAILEALLDAGGPLRNPRAVVPQSPSALERAAYYSGATAPLDSTRLLVRRLRADAGGRGAGKDDAARWSAAGMAANQGNAEALHILLTDLAAHTPPREFREALIDGDGVLFSVMTSSVFPCVAGGEKCARCQNAKVVSSHSPDVSLDKTLRAMISVSGSALQPLEDRMASLVAMMRGYGASPAFVDVYSAAWRRAWKPSAGCGVVPFKPMRCARCRGASYCSAACQRAAWPEHKLLCAPAPRGAK
jgi:hypothetical protein